MNDLDIQWVSMRVSERDLGFSASGELEVALGREGGGGGDQ